MFEVNKALVELNGTIVVQLINFLIVIWLLNRMLFKPLSRVISERESRINSWIDEAASHNAEMTGMIGDYNQAIDSTNREVNSGLLERKEMVKEEVTREVSAASERASRLVADAEEDLKKEVDRVREELSGQTEELAAEVVSKILGRTAS